MPDKQLSIPGLEAAPFFLCLKSTREVSAPPADRVIFLEKRISSLDLELAILKIQMEQDYA